ncbi:hypothetical protein DV736_g815, partial [Chaetothyriales sp. CBS 134916]
MARPPTLHLRSEDKPLEHRSALTPATAKALLAAGYAVNVERSPARIFDDAEFAAVGARLVPEHSWAAAPVDDIIVGLKELPEASFPLQHTHVQFAHCYKQQSGWQQVLARFPRGGGTLLDLEFLTDDKGRRAWAYYLANPAATTMPAVKPFANQALLLDAVRAALQAGKQIAHGGPRVLVVGALGRCGRGAVDLCKQAGIPDHSILQWDLAETAKGGPFAEIVESDIFVNCIYLSEPMAPLINSASLSSASRKLSVVCDVSCDTTNPHNPVPIYTENSTFASPTLAVAGYQDPPLHVISIDHLPSLLPRESSEVFSQALLPSLLTLNDGKTTRVWQQAEELFKTKVASLPAELQAKDEEK